MGMGIDKNSNKLEGDSFIQGDFETIEIPKGVEYDLIWISRSLECFLDPKKALKKCFDVLSDSGVIYIATPDTDFMNAVGLGGYIHWKERENYIMWNRASLSKILEKIGFDILCSRRNYNLERHGNFYEMHMIAQKIYF